jgi:hypothetical protein
MIKHKQYTIADNVVDVTWEPSTRPVIYSLQIAGAAWPGHVKKTALGRYRPVGGPHRPIGTFLRMPDVVAAMLETGTARGHTPDQRGALVAGRAPR